MLEEAKQSKAESKLKLHSDEIQHHPHKPHLLVPMCTNLQTEIEAIQFRSAATFMHPGT
jgi:hypothetical protein